MSCRARHKCPLVFQNREDLRLDPFWHSARASQHQARLAFGFGQSLCVIFLHFLRRSPPCPGIRRKFLHRPGCSDCCATPTSAITAKLVLARVRRTAVRTPVVRRGVLNSFRLFIVLSFFTSSSHAIGDPPKISLDFPLLISHSLAQNPCGPWYNGGGTTCKFAGQGSTPRGPLTQIFTPYQAAHSL